MILTINGRSDTDLGVVVRDLSGWRDGPSTQRAFLGLSGMSGGLLSARAVGQSREIRVVFDVDSGTVASRADVFAALSEATQGLCELSFADAPTLITRAVVTARTTVDVQWDPFVVPRALLALTFTAADGASYDTAPSLYALSTTPTPIRLGTLPSLGIVHVFGGWSGTRTLDYRSPNGILYGQLSLTVPVAVTFAAAAFVELDLARRVMTYVAATGTRLDAYAWKTAGRWFACDPTDTTRALGAHPTLALSAGTGVYLTRRAWSV